MDTASTISLCLCRTFCQANVKSNGCKNQTKYREHCLNKFVEIFFICPITIAKDFLECLFCPKTKPCGCQLWLPVWSKVLPREAEWRNAGAVLGSFFNLSYITCCFFHLVNLSTSQKEFFSMTDLFSLTRSVTTNFLAKASWSLCFWLWVSAILNGW